MTLTPQARFQTASAAEAALSGSGSPPPTPQNEPPIPAATDDGDLRLAQFYAIALSAAPRA